MHKHDVQDGTYESCSYAEITDIIRSRIASFQELQSAYKDPCMEEYPKLKASFPIRMLRIKQDIRVLCTIRHCRRETNNLG